MSESGVATHPDANGEVADAQPVTLPDGETMPSELACPAPEPVKPIPAKVRSGPTDDDLAQYDAETVRMVNAAESVARAADGEYEDFKATTATAKKRAEAKVDELRALIRERSELRGKASEATLLDYAKPAAEPIDPKAWRSRPLTDLDALTSAIRNTIGSFMCDTLGDLHDELAAGQTFGLTLGIVSDIRGELEHFLDTLATQAEEAKQPSTDPELWRQYPIERWTEFGLTAKDVERLAAGEIKSGGSHPIATVGDLNLFVTPNPSCPSYARGYKDIKGIGAAGCDRISDAETRFWAWWGNKGEPSFATERGLIRGAEVVAGTDGRDPLAGDDCGADGADGADGDDTDVWPSELEADPGAAEAVEV